MSHTETPITTPLSSDQCAGLAESIAADPDLWQQHVKREAEQRHCAPNEHDDDPEVYMIS